jgi:predicted CXXCH cytochrome family protein
MFQNIFQKKQLMLKIIMVKNKRQITKISPSPSFSKRGVAILLFLLLATAFIPGARGEGVYNNTKHGNPLTGVTRDAAIPRGSCKQCHSEGSGAIKYPKSLWRENDNELCYTCHRNETLLGIYPGQRIYDTSTHGTEPRFVWPGPFPSARKDIDAAGKCQNCHNPHGSKDRIGIIPNLLIAREETLCLGCHDGAPAGDILREARKPYSHLIRQGAGKHSSDEDGNPARYSYAGGNRHAECSDCHNAHAIQHNVSFQTAPAASGKNSRVSRIQVINSSPESIPGYQYISSNDTGAPLNEYEICYKCHSSWTQQPPGQPDMARLFNTNNASFHPVEGQGKNQGIDPNSFTGSVNVSSSIYCSDCHGSNDSNLRGSHGSQFPNILRRPYEAQSNPRVTARDELCFICHNYDTYVNAASASLFQQASRFNAPASINGHVFHVGQKNIPCYTCHDSHGSARFGALIVIRRNPGLLSFSMSSNGGSCLSTCHEQKTYTINYPR